MNEKIKILIADDKIDVCESLKETILIEIEKFGLSDNDFEITTIFTEHAYDHGCDLIKSGYVPDICIFDLVFNGYTGIDLYKFILNRLSNVKIDLCIYTGVEKTYERRKDAEVLASQMLGLVHIVEKPNIDEILDWFGDLMNKKYNLNRKIEEIDPFDLL